MGTEKPYPRSGDKVTLLIFLLGGSLTAWILFGLFAREIAGLFRLTGAEIEQLGQFGDTFGAINALFTSLAFAGLIYTALLQKTELGMQREELAETRRVLMAQEKQLEEQTRTFQQQALENRFFQLLTLLQSIVNTMDIRSGGNTINQGRDCFRSYYHDMEYGFKIARNNVTSENFGFKNPAYSLPIARGLSNSKYIELQQERGQQIPKDVMAAYLYMFAERQGDLGHYFRTLYHIIKYVDRSTWKAEEKRFFVSLVRAQLSLFELFVLFYNCLGPYGYEFFKPLAEKYALFENLDLNYLFDPAHKDLFGPSAFGPASIAQVRT